MDTRKVDPVVERELERIADRRSTVGMQNGDDAKNFKEQIRDGRKGLVGLALSGGGVRSAAFNLGLLQSLRKHDRFREIDYLSTVSGGGYVGGYVSSIAAEPVGKPNSPDPLLDMPSDGRQPEGVDALIDRCRYLNRLLPWLNRQLIGFLLINVVVVSGLVAFAATLAWAFRLLDDPGLRDIPTALGFRSDIGQAFFYSFLLFLAWLAAWGLSYIVRGARAVGVIAQVLALLLIVSLFLGAAAVAGNGDVSLDGLNRSRDITRESESQVTSYLNGYFPKAVVGALIAMLIPYLNPKALIRSATQPKNTAQRWIYAVASRALLFGVPLLMFYIFARENISRHQEDLADRRRFNTFKQQLTEQEKSLPQNRRQPDLVHADITNWSAFWDQVGSDSRQPALQDASVWRVPPQFASKILDKAVRSVKYREALENDAVKESFYVQTPAVFRWLSAFAYLFRQEPDNDFYQQYARIGEYRLSGNEVLSGVNSSFEDTTLTDDWPSWNLPRLLPETQPVTRLLRDCDRLRVQLGRARAFQVVQLLRLQAILELDAAQITALIDQTLRNDEIDAINWQLATNHRDLLARFYPDYVAPLGTIYSYRVLNADQRTRLSWARGAGLVFLISLLLVNLNATSLHHWYRNALRHAWLQREGGAQIDLPLEQLDTCARGLPYHLINTTVSLTWSQLGEDLRTDTFTLSPEFCGSELTGYEPTSRFSGGQLDLASAMAISGAAISPTQIPDPLTAVILTLSNSRLGQWFVNPNRKPWLPDTAQKTTMGQVLCWISKKLWISPGAVLFHWVLMRPFQTADTRRYCLLSDGGYTENLGVEQLLLRRCRLIIASDASADPDYDFVSFDEMQTRMSAKYGIRLTKLNEKDVPVALDSLVPNRRSTISAHHLIVCSIDYPDSAGAPVQAKNATGYLVYVKPSFSGDEGYLNRYRKQDGSFPFDPTYDQMFDAPKFIAYIELGRHIGDALVAEFALAGAGSWGNLHPTPPPAPAGLAGGTAKGPGRQGAGAAVGVAMDEHWLDQKVEDTWKIVSDDALPEEDRLQRLREMLRGMFDGER